LAQEQTTGTRRCAVCGETSEGRARYCWNCGARLTDAPTTFTESLAAVVPETTGLGATDAGTAATPSAAADVVNADAAPVVAPSVAPAWTASTDVWTSAAGATSAAPTAAGIPTYTPPARKGKGRTIWIVLGILAFIVLFCCVASIVLVAVASNDSAFQDQVSLFAQARR
jgi:hypothetical protein